jgi:hypothetical protein
MSVNISLRVPLIALMVTAGSLAAQPALAAGGLFDFLGSVFGGGGSNAPAVQEDSPLDVTVHPRRAKRSIRRNVEASHGKPTNTAIDPVQHPNWYLEDPTLRRGDIVVLPGGVLVYEGGRGPAQRDDFSSLSRSRLVSKTERQKIGAMVGPKDTTTQTVVVPEALPRTVSAAVGE